MISMAQLAIDRAEAGLPSGVEDVPPFQWEVRWEDLSRLCPSLLGPRPGIDFNRQKNALRIEIVPSSTRCSLQSPDGRGLAWLLSGGSPVSYGMCCRAGCPRIGGVRR